MGYDFKNTGLGFDLDILKISPTDFNGPILTKSGSNPRTLESCLFTVHLGTLHDSVAGFCIMASEIKNFFFAYL